MLHTHSVDTILSVSLSSSTCSALIPLTTPSCPVPLPSAPVHTSSSSWQYHPSLLLSTWTPHHAPFSSSASSHPRTGMSDCVPPVPFPQSPTPPPIPVWLSVSFHPLTPFPVSIPILVWLSLSLHPLTPFPAPTPIPVLLNLPLPPLPPSAAPIPIPIW